MTEQFSRDNWKHVNEKETKYKESYQSKEIWFKFIPSATFHELKIYVMIIRTKSE